MLNDDGGTLRAVAWSEICPWLKLVRCFRLAIRFRLMLLSAVAVLLTVSGWALLVILFSLCSGDPGITGQVPPDSESPWSAFPDLVRSASTDLVPDRPQLPNLDLSLVARKLGLDLAADGSASIVQRTPEPFWGTFTQLSRPLRQVFSFDVTAAKLAFLLLCGLWGLAVWAFFGGAITRVAAVELAREERVAWGAMIRYASSKWRAYFAAPLLLLVGVSVCTLGMGLVGILLRWNVGLLIAGSLLWPLMLLGGWAIAFLLVWLAFGWPLMWATISAEGEDSFDALSRSQQYVFGRPLQYLFYALVAVLLGWLGWLVVSNFAAAVIASTNWAASWGAGEGQIGLVGGQFQLLMPDGEGPRHVGLVGSGVMVFWCGCVKMLAVGFLYSYFWTASTCIYFLLRRDADGTEMDEVFLEEEEDEMTFGLPPLTTDEAGAPVVDDDAVPPDTDVDLSSEE